MPYDDRNERGELIHQASFEEMRSHVLRALNVLDREGDRATVGFRAAVRRTETLKHSTAKSVQANPEDTVEDAYRVMRIAYPDLMNHAFATERLVLQGLWALFPSEVSE